MKKTLLNSASGIPVLSLGLLLLLPGCTWFEGQEQMERDEVLENAAIEVLTEGVSVLDKETLTGDVFVTMNGQPIVTSNSLESEKEKLFEANPQLKQMIAFMDPVQLDRNIAQGLMNQAMLDQYISENGIDKTAAYQKELKEGFKAVERMVNTKFFTQSFDVKVTDADARTFYNENKNVIPELVISRGGVKAMGVSFDSEEAARAFAAQIQNGDINAAAQANNLTDRIRDFTVDTQSMGIDAEVKNKLMAMTTFPAVDVIVVNDKTVWVVAATGKEETQYRPFEQVKDGLKDYLEKEARAKNFDTKMDELKKRYNVEIKADFLNESDDEAAMEEAMMQAVDADFFDDAADTVAFYEHEEDVEAI